MILHKKKDTLNRLCCIMKVTKQTLQHLRKKVSLANTIHHSTFIYNQFKKLNLCKSLSNRVIGHLMSILISIFISGYHGKTTDFAQNSSCHRTTIAHFLNSGKWDDTIASKTKPSSQALHPIEDAYFHQSHLKGKQDYGHQAVAVMLSCNGIVLNYAFVLYNKSISKIDIVQSIAKELPEPPVMSYFLCDCWYVSEKLINTFVQKGFHTIGALKTNRLLYPSGMKKKLSELAAELSVTEKGFDLVTVKNRKYYVYRYEGNLNGIENAVVLLSYPEKAFGNPKALRAFISTNVALSTLEILSCYVCRWNIMPIF